MTAADGADALTFGEFPIMDERAPTVADLTCTCGSAAWIAADPERVLQSRLQDGQVLVRINPAALACGDCGAAMDTFRLTPPLTSELPCEPLPPPAAIDADTGPLF